MYDLVLKGGTLVVSEDVFEGDLAVRGGKIAAIGQALDADESRCLDLRGKIVLPGAIDPHVHMALPVASGTPLGETRSCDDFLTGTMAAASGGVTTIIDFTVGSRQTTMPGDLENRLKAARDSVIDYAFHAEVVGWTPARLDEMREVAEMGVRSFKFFTAYASSGRRTENGPLLESMHTLAEIDGLAVVHAEDESVIQTILEQMTDEQKSRMTALGLSRPDVCEACAIDSVAWLARYAGARVHIVHLSSQMGLEELLKARREGTDITAETCPQYLLLTDEVYKKEEARFFSAAPALRTVADQQALWRALSKKDLAFLATDHCPFTREQKAWQGRFDRLPYGLPGVELMLPLAYSEGVLKGRFSLSDLAELTSTAAAKLYGLYPRKGNLLPGADADVAVIDPEAEWTVKASGLRSNCDFSPYEGLPMRGKVHAALSRGELIYRDGEFMGRPGRGRFLAR
ncbi:MAG: dihydropyrimidinase [Synergistaceae bacterium]|jgi:dihydropyrimidinase|nr:dihydropyrimidinase [Synergistaceae bacterium]